MELPIPNKLEKLWDLWDIRLSILLSLLLQVFLVLFTPFGQRSRNSFLMLIWSAYLIADWIATVTIGLITKSHTDSRVKPQQNEDVLAFWASFLLLHLSGPDSITSFALEDNELWLRYLFGRLLQVLGAGYSFFLTLPKNQLWLLTILVFVVGTIKYAERMVALYLASLDCFGSTTLPKPYPGPDYEEAVSIYSTTRSVEVLEQTEITMAPEFDELKLMDLAHSLFENFKGLIVGFLLSSKYRESSQEFFLQRKPEFLVDKDEFKKFELILTYYLLTGAIVLDIFSGIKLIFSDHSSEKNIDDLKSFILEELKNKSSKAKTLSEAMEKCSQRGDGALFGTPSYIKLKWSISQFQYTESLLLWHLATELCYNAEKKTNPEGDDRDDQQ
ncbi:uncharacterized protein LOC132800535 [Ziziphus jujuba]|uniref:Uncharacterized protein LOC132800535 n=1 Tax=Ziziphus jujuba TaxID=326968 RepID=A0ABM4A135_ZIZJJ|nr:uncharacterized protein LOC132800535 [Ziziphus jujuba]